MLGNGKERLISLKCEILKTFFKMALFNFINQVFNENRVIVMLKSAAGGRAAVNVWFPLNNLSLLRPIDTKLAV